MTKKIETVAINRKGARVVINCCDFRSGQDDLWEDYLKSIKKSKMKKRVTDDSCDEE